MTTGTITQGKTPAERAKVLIGASWSDTENRTWVVKEMHPDGEQLVCKIKGSRGGDGSVIVATIDGVRQALGMTDEPETEPTYAPDTLVGRTFIGENGSVWTVTGPDPDIAGNVLIHNEVSNSTATVTEAEIRERLGVTERLAAAVPEEVFVIDLLGRAWRDDGGITWTIDRIDVEIEGNVIAVDDFGESDERSFPMADVLELLAQAEVDETELVGIKTDPTTDLPPFLGFLADLPPIDQELANAGSTEDEQYRQRHSVPGPRQPKRWSLPDSVKASIEAEMQSLIALLGRHGGSGKVTFNGKAKYKAADEIEFAFEVGMTPPKLKSSGHFYDGDEIVPGLPKREPAAQTTVFDAPAGEVSATRVRPAGALPHRVAHALLADGRIAPLDRVLTRPTAQFVDRLGPVLRQ